MVAVFGIMIALFIVLAVINLVKINILALQIIKDKELNNQENPKEKKYQFIKGLY